MAGPPHRHIPQTKAEYIAWGFGMRMAEDGDEIVTTLFASRLHPAGYLTADEESAWGRLEAHRFWRWAMAGYTAVVEEQDRA